MWGRSNLGALGFDSNVGGAAMTCRRWRTVSTPMQFKGEIMKGRLRNPWMPEEMVQGMPVYDMKNGWVSIHTKEGRPYYHHAESGTTQWNHPRTNEVRPPNTPAMEANVPAKSNSNIMRNIRYGITAFCAFAVFGGTPLLGHLFGDGPGAKQRAVRQSGTSRL